MNPSTFSAGYVSGHRATPTLTPDCEAIDHSGRARQVVAAFG